MELKISLNGVRRKEENIPFVFAEMGLVWTYVNVVLLSDGNQMKCEVNNEC